MLGSQRPIANSERRVQIGNNATRRPPIGKLSGSLSDFKADLRETRGEMRSTTAGVLPPMSKVLAPDKRTSADPSEDKREEIKSPEKGDERMKVIEELWDTERQYVSDLEVMVNVRNSAKTMQFSILSIVK